jgi:hypothetical protein
LLLLLLLLPSGSWPDLRTGGCTQCAPRIGGVHGPCGAADHAGTWGQVRSLHRCDGAACPTHGHADGSTAPNHTHCHSTTHLSPKEEGVPATRGMRARSSCVPRPREHVRVQADAACVRAIQHAMVLSDGVQESYAASSGWIAAALAQCSAARTKRGRAPPSCCGLLPCQRVIHCAPAILRPPRGVLLIRGACLDWPSEYTGLRGTRSARGGCSQQVPTSARCTACCRFTAPSHAHSAHPVHSDPAWGAAAS